MRLALLPIAPPLLRFARSSFWTALMLIALSLAALAHAGSVYVPVDSWVYPAAERLAALTYTRTEVVGMRPWTRAQFAHFVQRARASQHGVEALKLQSSLEHEFAPELNNAPEPAALESVYARATQIAGPPLRDSYHLGQTIADDFGRPYGQGFNAITGGSGYLQHRAGFSTCAASTNMQQRCADRLPHRPSLPSPSVTTLRVANYYPRAALPSITSVCSILTRASLLDDGQEPWASRVCGGVRPSAVPSWKATTPSQSGWPD